ncbi:MAG: response regulator transcription factor [Chloroflexi bacterium]|nr:response regulator transcription factor [Chloroflexota bacterium]
MEPISVLIVDDHKLFREGLRSLLNSIPDIVAVGDAANGQEGIEQAEALQPDIILMDIQMPIVNGIEATRRIFSTSPHIGVIMVTMFEDDDSVFAAMRAGAKGYMLKHADQKEMLNAIRAVASGEAVFSPGIARRLIKYFQDLHFSSPVEVKQIFPELTDRERQVLELIAQGYSNTEIAQKCFLSSKTVRNHVSNIFSKLQVADRAQAIVRARQAGMGLS